MTNITSKIKIINKLNLRINNIINEIDQFNFLGQHLNSCITWDAHIKEVSTKILPFIRTTGIIQSYNYYLLKLVDIYKFRLLIFFIIT